MTTTPSVMTDAELVNARRVITGRWPAWYRRRHLRRLPRHELRVFGLLAGLLDAEPVDEDTLEPLADIEARQLKHRPRLPAPGMRVPPPDEWLELGARLGAREDGPA